MRRSVLAILGTIAGTSLMLAAKLGTPPPDTAAAVTDDNGVAAAAANDPSGAGAPSASGAPVPAKAGAPSNGAPAPPPGGPTPGPGSTTTKPTQPPPTTNPPAGGFKDGSYTGAGAAVSRYGYTMTVSITVSGGRISAANFSCGSASGESRSICQGRSPKLVSETLSAQSANVATVSGATYTSGAYKVSLQSAIDKAKA